MSDFHVHKMAHYVPVTILGKDEQGRTLVRCPELGCGETATVMEDNSIVCPIGQAEAEFIRQGVDKLLAEGLSFEEPR